MLYQYEHVVVSDQLIPTDARSANDIVDHVEWAVGAGLLAPGMRLPPVRDMAASTGLAPNTVASAYRTLRSRGVVEGRGRHGTFITSAAGLPQAHVPVPEGFIDLASGNPDRRLLPDLGRYLAELDVEHTLYGETQLDPALERSGRVVLTGMGVPVGPLAVASGALDGVERSLGAHLRIGDAVAVEAPGWPAFVDLVTALGMRPVPVEIDDRGMIPERLAEVAAGVDAVILTPRSQNPTGAVMDSRRAGQLRAVLDRNPGLLVIEDDHGGLISGAPLALVGPGRDRWVYLQSVSKSLGPDLRVAMITGDERTVTAIVSRQSVGPGWVSHVLQRLVAAILGDPDTAPLLERAVETYAVRRGLLIEALARDGIEARGRSGINVWIQVPEEEPVVSAMAAAGYAIRAGERWRLGTPPAVRVSVSGLEVDRIAEVAEIIAAGCGGARASVRTRSG